MFAQQAGIALAASVSIYPQSMQTHPTPRMLSTADLVWAGALFVKELTGLCGMHGVA